LERYIERLEKQVGVQQNMMEMMSTGGASFVDKMVGPGLTHCESKDLPDNISLSGMSLGSHYVQRASSSSVVGGHSTVGGTASNARPRTLLPPESSKKQKQVEQAISPLCSPKSPQDVIIGDIVVEERDVSSAYYRSETTTEAETPTEDAESMPTHRRKPSLSLDDEDLVSKAREEVLSPLSSNGPVLSQQSTESMIKSPGTPAGTDNNTTPSLHIDTSSTPVQSNSLLDQALSVDVEASKHRKVHDLPSVDTSVDQLQPLVTFPPTDPDDEDDIKSRVSDITEDRTQRQIDDDLAERRKILLAYVQGNAGGNSSNASLSASTQRRLETIENMIPNGNGGSASRGGVLARVGSATSLESIGVGSQESGKLSVAQRARLAADSRSNTHRTPSPMKSIVKDETSAASNKYKAPVRAASPAPLERSGSFFSKLGKSIENLVDNTIVGKSYDDSDYESGSETSASASATSSQPASKGPTLQERIAMQRQKQVEFLKNKGVIDDESSLHGGAGGSSISSSKGTSTPSSRLATPRRGRIGSSWSRGAGGSWSRSPR
jgi:hypothetical protein